MSDGAEARPTRYQIGDIVASRFQITKLLGSSEGGDAYLVQETERKRRMVLKHLAIPYVGDEGYEALREEIKEASLIRHKNLVQVFGLGKEHTDLFLVMEFVEGETLHAHLRGRRERGQTMGLKAAYNLIAHVCNAMQVVHEAGAFHGTLTPRNIYITPQGKVKVANLVYGKLVSRHLAAEQRGAFFDSPFVAPETHEDESALGPTADLFSLGLLAAELISEQSLEGFDGSVEAFVDGVVAGRSAALQDLLFNAIVRMPTVRLASVKDFKAGLKEAVDAPGDTELSSIVMGASDLHAMAALSSPVEEDFPEPIPERKRDLFDLPDLPPPPGASEAFAADVAAVSEAGDVEEEIWLVQREGLDYGPFTRTVVIGMLHKDEINENSSVLNMLTQRRADLIDLREFRGVVQAYIPVREQRRAREAAERERKIEQVKTGAKFSAAGLIAGGIAIVTLSVIAYLQLPDPVPIEFGAAIAAFPHTFEVPKVEEIALNVDTSQALAIFDPKASEAEREAALATWAEEHRKRIEEKRRKRPRRGGRRPSQGGTASPDDDFDESSSSISFAVGDDGQELEALDDWEIEEQLYSASSFRKQSDCFMQYGGGRGKRVSVDFVIVQSGQVKKVTTNVSGELDECLKRIFRSMRFRAFGGTIKKVSYPIEFG